MRENCGIMKLTRKRDFSVLVQRLLHSFRKISLSCQFCNSLFHLFGALAEFEKNLIQERTQAGLSAARARGRLGGRQKRLDLAKRSLVVKLYKDKESTAKEICSMMGISKPTLYKYLREYRALCIIPHLNDQITQVGHFCGLEGIWTISAHECRSDH